MVALENYENEMVDKCNKMGEMIREQKEIIEKQGREIERLKHAGNNQGGKL